jgi:hypothetical protein
MSADDFITISDVRTGQRREVKLTRFRGHANIWVQGKVPRYALSHGIFTKLPTTTNACPTTAIIC